MELIEALVKLKVLPIMRNVKKENAVRYAALLLREGINVLEVTMSSSDSLEIVRSIQSRFPDLTVGVGTVLSPSQALSAVESGAKFVVSPGCSEALMKSAESAGFFLIPGVATPTEIMKVLEHGLITVKVFPASVLTTAFFREMKGPFPDVRMIATGGITVDNAAEFLKAGAQCVGIGSALFKDRDGADVSEEELCERLRLLAELLKGEDKN